MAKVVEKLGPNPDPAKLGVGKHADGGGLYLLVSAGPDGAVGRSRWVARVTIDGKTVDRGLGAAGVNGITANAARAELARLKARIERGEVGAAADAAAGLVKPSGPTFGAIADNLLDEVVATYRNETHRAQWRTSMTVTCRPLSAKPVADISIDDVLQIIRPLWLKTPETARRTRARIERVLDRATALGHRPHGPNPASWAILQHILPTRRAPAGHHLAMPWQEVPAFMKELRTMRVRSVSSWALEWTILNTCRSGETRGLTWSEVADPAVWRIPASRMKSEREHAVPLTLDAMEILAPMRHHGNVRPDDLVFPGVRSRSPLSDMSLLMVLRRMGIHYTVHGFRSSFRDWVFDNQIAPREVAEFQLAHVVENRTEAAYLRSRGLELRRELLVKWAAFLRTGTI